MYRAVVAKALILGVIAFPLVFIAAVGLWGLIYGRGNTLVLVLMVVVPAGILGVAVQALYDVRRRLTVRTTLTILIVLGVVVVGAYFALGVVGDWICEAQGGDSRWIPENGRCYESDI
jgi:hypothetical protein